MRLTFRGISIVALLLTVSMSVVGCGSGGGGPATETASQSELDAYLQANPSPPEEELPVDVVE